MYLIVVFQQSGVRTDHRHGQSFAHMNQGHRLDLKMSNTFSEESPSKDTMDVDTFIRESLSKTNNGDEDEDTQLCYTLPGSEISKEDSRVNKYMGPLADRLTKTDRGDGDEDKQTDAALYNTPQLPAAVRGQQ